VVATRGDFLSHVQLILVGSFLINLTSLLTIVGFPACLPWKNHLSSSLPQSAQREEQSSISYYIQHFLRLPAGSVNELSGT